MNDLSADLGEKERKCASQTQELLSLSDQVQRHMAELKQVSTAKEDLSQNVRHFVGL